MILEKRVYNRTIMGKFREAKTLKVTSDQFVGAGEDRGLRKDERHPPLATFQPGGKAAAEAETDRADSRCVPGK